MPKNSSHSPNRGSHASSLEEIKDLLLKLASNNTATH